MQHGCAAAGRRRLSQLRARTWLQAAAEEHAAVDRCTGWEGQDGHRWVICCSLLPCFQPWLPNGTHIEWWGVHTKNKHTKPVPQCRHPGKADIAEAGALCFFPCSYVDHLNSQFGIPDTIQFNLGLGGLPRVWLRHPHRCVTTPHSHLTLHTLHTAHTAHTMHAAHNTQHCNHYLYAPTHSQPTGDQNFHSHA